jgi:aminocarboxymuconate-semialdehyde decarboxylase
MESSIDLHSHIYLPLYVQMLRERNRIPRIIPAEDGDRLLILPMEGSGREENGRKIDASFWDINLKLKYMEAHSINITVLSMGNPWLDFLDPQKAVELAYQLNQDLEDVCGRYSNKFYGFGVLPLQDIPGSMKELERIAGFTWIRGAIMGTKGAGQGLDDPTLDPFWERANELGLPLFLHPHYGIAPEHFGNFFYSLNFALGFPFETTIAVARLAFCGVLERFRNLKFILAHAGGTLPYLSGRLDSCTKYSPVTSRLEHKPSFYIRRLYYDSLALHEPAVRCAVAYAGPDRLVFGTDHPFRGDPREIYSSLKDLNREAREAILNKNATFLLNLESNEKKS